MASNLLGDIMSKSGMNSRCSKKLVELKKELEVVEEDSLPILFEKCKGFVQGIILDGMNSYDSFYQAYCSYAVSMGINYEYGRHMDIMWVSLRNGSSSLNINPLSVVSLVDSDGEILFMVAHEVKHLLSSHLVKYYSMFIDDVVTVFMNICTDAEVNERLIGELYGYYSRERILSNGLIPKNCITLKSVGRMLSEDACTLDRIYSKFAKSKNFLFRSFCIKNLI